MLKLLNIQLLNFFDINKTIYCKDSKEKRHLLFMAIIFLFVFVNLFIFSFLYTFNVAKAYETSGVLHLLMPMLMLTCSMIAFITTLYKASGLLFRFKDYEMLIALPIKTSTIIGSRILLLYIMNLLLNLLVMIPGCIAYGYIAHPTLSFYILFAISLLFIPLVPIIIATFIGTMISFIASRFKSVQLVSLIFTFGFLIAFILLSMQLEEISSEIIDLSQILMATIHKTYPLAVLYGIALNEQSLWAFFLFIGLSVFAFLLFVWCLSQTYTKLNTRLAASSSLTMYKERTLKTASPFVALYKKELKRYFSSSLYVLNTGFGVLLLVITSIIFVFSSDQSLEILLQTPGLSQFLNSAMPFAISLCCIMSCTTACSISLEGNNLWIIKSSPIKAHTLFMSKVAVNLTIVFPAIFISSSLFAYSLKTTLLETVLLYLLPLSYTVFIALLGLLINLRFPTFNWSSETIAIKQSLPSILTPFVGLISIGIAFIPFIFNFTFNLSTLALSTCLSLFLLSFLLYAYLRQKGTILLNKL